MPDSRNAVKKESKALLLWITALLLPQDQINHPATSDVRSRPSAVVQGFLVDAASFLQGIVNNNKPHHPKLSHGGLPFLVQCSVAFKHKRKEKLMPETSGPWVVYLMTGKKTNGMKAVCEKTEWDALERAKPGLHHLVQEGIATETEAELLARGESGATKPRSWKNR